MKAFLLSAGLGTRLRPLTDKIPKCLVPIGGEPLLGIWIKKLESVGIDTILINTHYLADEVERFINSKTWCSEIRTVHESILLGTAGSLLNNIDFFYDDDVMLVHADNYCMADLSKFVAAHRERPDSSLMTMLTFSTSMPHECGIIEVDELGMVTQFYEKTPVNHGNIANAAVYILSKDMLRMMKHVAINSKVFDFSVDVIPLFLGLIYTHHTEATMIDIGTAVNYQRANCIAASQSR